MTSTHAPPRENRIALSEQEFRDNLVAIIPDLRVFARGLCKGRPMADDMVQDALTRAWSARTSYESGSNFRAWMFMILRNQFYTTVRKMSRMASWDPEAAERILVAPATQDWQIEVADVTAALQKISPEQREVLMLVGANGMSYEEAAEIAGCAIGTIKSRMARGRAALKAILEDGAANRIVAVGETDQPAEFSSGSGMQTGRSWERSLKVG